jgi:hypothetical protein
MSCQFKSDEKTQRHKGTEAQRRAIKNLGCASLCLCVFVSLCFSRRLLLLIRDFEPHDA